MHRALLQPARCTASALLLALVAGVGTARADASAADKAAARDLGIQGIQLADKGDCAGALVPLQKAASLFPAPTIVERLGECQIELGKIVAGTESLQSVVHEDLGPSPSPAFVEAQKRAQKVLELSLPRIAKLVLHLVGPKPADASITVDGEKMPSALLDAERPTDPGHHDLAASAPGFRDGTTPVDLTAGKTTEVTLTLEPLPASAAAPAPVPPAPAPAQPTGPLAPAGPSSSGSPVPAIVAFAAGGVGVALGSVFGLMAAGKKSSLDQVCQSKNCPTTSQGDIDAMNTDATVSTVGFSVGLVGVGVGIVLLMVRPGEGSASPSSVGLTVGPGSLGLSGAF